MENGQSTSVSHFIGYISTSLSSSSITDTEQTGALLRGLYVQRQKKNQIGSPAAVLILSSIEKTQRADGK